ncbi:GNAT family N-acetyltransferase [Dongia sedimenti]|uniref:GNAT family N-acetyltransferase n=1 Tax=Dongia sedimenti TaxID=3064282 RepID=A0ABU0YPI8_9PROT|nr:GNAT family N-acetyltransferase [Rhodospirillaceae bacterium R-7]
MGKQAMNFIIRPAVLDDALEIAEIHYLGWKHAYAGVVDEKQIAAKQPDRRLDYWKHKMSDPANLVLVGAERVEGPLLGFIYGGPVLPHEITREIAHAPKLQDFDCEINIVHCRHAVQGKGLGRALIAAIAHHWQVGGKRALMLWAFRDNDYRKLYDKLGGTVFAEGVDEGAPDVAYGWPDLNRLIESCSSSARRPL